MLLDEPAASMDPQLEEHIATHIFGMRPQDTTLVVVTHKLAMLRHFTRVIIVDRGRVVADGARDDILERIREGARTTSPAAAQRPQAPPGKLPGVVTDPELA
jgi:ATP-binding cassette subfamily C protein LapB